ncbi:MAG: hypothetical protein FWE21_03000 [Defluviitaleaceae bacterium]|nr:hypothetical protein [Defluviitaleaceae bacterium]
MRPFIFTLFSLLLVLAACGEKEPALTEYYIPVATLTNQLSAPANYENVIFLELIVELLNQPLARHESSEGVFLGAYIARDAISGGDIRSFQDYMGVSHAIFAYTMRLCDPFPIRWVLDNISNQTAPMITLLPPLYGNPFCLDAIKYFAQYAGIFHVPTFIQLYPIHGNNGFLPAEYTAFFVQAREVLAYYAPNAALVWGIDAENLPTARHFLPTENAVDWINLTAYSKVETDGSFDDFGQVLNMFHQMFSEITSLMLTTAVSHHSYVNNSHFPTQAADKLMQIYNLIDSNPRIRAIIYQNYSDLSGTGHIYTLNTSPVIRDGYRQAASHPRFINFVEQTDHPRNGNISLHRPGQAAARGYGFYIQTEGGLQPVSQIIQALNADFFVNKQKGTLTLQIPRLSYFP